MQRNYSKQRADYQDTSSPISVKETGKSPIRGESVDDIVPDGSVPLRDASSQARSSTGISGQSISKLATTLGVNTVGSPGEVNGSEKGTVSQLALERKSPGNSRMSINLAANTAQE